jgi:cysteinyl-tRNA synthetase
MSTCCLGNHFDIHGGGMDLQFPHHENEIAQSEGATGEKFVNLWMHNGFVRVNEEKMSKSLGNFFTVREVLKQYRPEIIRFFILTSHYRSPLNYSDGQLADALTKLNGFYIALRDCDGLGSVIETDYKARFEQAMDDDFNTPMALKVLKGLATELNIAKKEEDQKKTHLLASTLKHLGGLLGILQDDPDAFLKWPVADIVMQGHGFDAFPIISDVGVLTEANIEQQIQARLGAKKAKNWTLADQIRDELKQQGIILEDAPNGTTSWRRE